MYSTIACAVNTRNQRKNIRGKTFEGKGDGI